MTKNIKIALYIVIVCLLLPVKVYAQQTTVVTGIVTDSLTHEPLSYVSVFLKGTQVGGMTDENGKYSLRTTGNCTEVVFSSLGYVEKSVPVRKGITNHIDVALLSASYTVKEVVITPGKEKYRRKGNPAVEFVKKMIAHRDDYSPKNQDFYQYDEYEKLTLALNDFSEEQKKKWLFKKFQFIFDYVDTSEVSGKPILTVSIKEKVAKNYYRKDPHTEKKFVTGIKRAGIDEMFNQESLQQFYDEVFKEVDIYNNDVNIMLNRFVSPLSNIGPSFYKYYLLDTLDVNGEKCVDLGFVPFNSESFGFTGHLYVTLDSTYFVKKIKLNVPKDINLNYVSNMAINQEYSRAKDGTRIKEKDDMIVEFQLVPGTQGLYARRLTSYNNYEFSPPEDMSLFSKEGNVIVEDDAEVKPDAYWADNRQIPIKSKENAVDKLLVKLRSVPVFYYTEKIISILVSGYIETAKDSKFDIGPMNTTISGNGVEGARFRVGGLTTANLSPNWFTRGYVAYGTRDKKFKYSAEVEYSFNKKKYHAREFPIHSLKVSHTYDLNQLGQHYLYTNKDNIFLSLKRMKDDRSVYERKSEINYLREHESGFSYGLNARYMTEYATASPQVEFILQNGTRLRQYSQAEAEIKLRYAPNEKFYQTKTTRYPITKDAPIFTLSHTVGIKGIFDSKYNVNHTELGIQKRFWFSAFGYTDILIKAGKVWDKAPYPMLIIPNANLSYTIREESYELMNPMEFINDEYVSWDLTYWANGALLNRIPLIKYLKLREVVAFRGLYGNLTKKNNPENSIFIFPKETQLMSKMPYMEASVGLDNIFTVLRIDYVWRLTYRNLPNISKSGVRIALHFNF
ncbi:MULTISPECIES: DUF5686 and carboxypeptidase-like regulatory domain-containing protein [Bacteroidales]|uniref:DUF5686 and carboxypeptidase-like regulatory domain-containing protein n=1 Tax=Bacteroidales TaxID=171549 RepID=UPI000574F647|nr:MULTISPECIES: DUF5686 and carboxypeptidase-like regulatory domain-containing protein [Bacteroidales]KHM47813.1 collagen-binding protein [Coprobacter secundus]